MIGPLCVSLCHIIDLVLCFFQILISSVGLFGYVGMCLANTVSFKSMQVLHVGWTDRNVFNWVGPREIGLGSFIFKYCDIIIK